MLRGLLYNWCIAVFSGSHTALHTTLNDSAEAIIYFSLTFTGYGMTELSPVCHMTPFSGGKHGSVGVLLPGLECKVRLIETRCWEEMN